MTRTSPTRLGVLVSGSGSNLEAILTAVAAGELEATVAVVISNRAGVAALERAARYGVDARVIASRDHADRASFEAALDVALTEARVDLVVLAGFMRVLTASFVRRWSGRLLNIHPSLLPAFPGIDAQGQALAHGVRFTGCTVHLVDEGTDSGPIIAQAVVPVLPEDTRDALAERILAQEHRLYPAVLAWWVAGRVRVEGRAVSVEQPSAHPAVSLSNPLVGRPADVTEVPERAQISSSGEGSSSTGSKTGAPS